MFKTIFFIICTAQMNSMIFINLLQWQCQYPLTQTSQSSLMKNHKQICICIFGILHLIIFIRFDYQFPFISHNMQQVCISYGSELSASCESCESCIIDIYNLHIISHHRLSTFQSKCLQFSLSITFFNSRLVHSSFSASSWYWTSKWNWEETEVNNEQYIPLATASHHRSQSAKKKAIQIWLIHIVWFLNKYDIEYQSSY